MTLQQVAAVLTVVRMEWPHSSLGGESAEKITAYWHRILGECDTVAVHEAVKELIATGREHAPGPGVVLSMVATRANDVPDFDEAVREIERGLSRYRPPQPRGGFASEFEMLAAPPPEYWSHPAIASFITPAWHEWRMCRERDRRTFYAQQRDAYKALAARAQRSTALEAIGAPRRRGELTAAGGALSAAAARLLETG